MPCCQSDGRTGVAQILNLARVMRRTQVVRFKLRIRFRVMHFRCYHMVVNIVQNTSVFLNEILFTSLISKY